MKTVSPSLFFTSLYIYIIYTVVISNRSHPRGWVLYVWMWSLALETDCVQREENITYVESMVKMVWRWNGYKDCYFLCDICLLKYIFCAQKGEKRNFSSWAVACFFGERNIIIIPGENWKVNPTNIDLSIYIAWNMFIGGLRFSGIVYQVYD